VSDAGRATPVSEIVGTTVTGSDGKIGEVGQVFLDDQTAAPEWVTVRTGLFGTKVSLVPIAEATMSDDGGLTVPYSKSIVKDAPRIDVAGDLSPDEEANLYRYYGLDELSRHGGSRRATVKESTSELVDDAKSFLAELQAERGTRPHGV